MPSPFPGMDPYLEDPGLWPDVHHAIISEIQAMLNQQLRPKYFARVEERVYISDDNDPGRSVIVPDVRVVNGPRGQAGSVQQAHTAASSSGGKSGSVIFDEPQPIEVTAMVDEEVHEARVQVMDRVDRAIVAVIEVLSPANKIPGSMGRESYIEKRREIMRSPSHLIEIDLLRSGAAISGQPGLSPHQYLVHLSRHISGPKRRAWIWPIQLRQRLPRIPVPLRGNDPDCSLDLQEVLNRAYQRGAYDLDIDYSRSPVPPLEPALAAWSSETVEQAKPHGS